MLDWTDRHCRFFHRQLSSQALLYTEMVVADAIIYGDRDHFLAYDEAEHPIALQIAGSNPIKLSQAVEIANDYGYNEINLNVGCPSDRVQNGVFGACLMLNPELVAKSVEIMKKVSRAKVTVKCRIGVDDQVPELALTNLVETALKAGADGFWVHARKAWLQGLSPKENRDIPPLEYDIVYKLKQQYNDVFIAINGGITNINQAKLHLRYMDGVMLGRSCYKTPMILAEVDKQIYGIEKEFDIQKLQETMVEYSDRYIKQGGRLSHVTRHMLGLFHGKARAKEWRQTLTDFALNKESTGKDLNNIFNRMRSLSSES